MIVLSVRNALKSAGTPFVLVEGANELAQVKDRPPAVPAAYVFINSEASSENQRLTGPVLQRMQVDVSVVIITENAGGAEEASRDIETLKAWTRQALLGFQPADTADPFEHISGQIQKARDGMVWFEDVFGTATYLESQR
ncbi:hypothetical protein SAMN05880590_13211 [Rhizobium sp. RU35A]|uniref:phage tail terminator protein n=1 Tax=Rhizobium sp. RU35A TaxID=1907414 RepID=UPI0009572611|nr:hypothetical protein [Rhizobium sp. RU35A]SIR43207.1 hypothetical protein SAMN05880590_13211 [Rhizobium sp. RU35A]